MSDPNNNRPNKPDDDFQWNKIGRLLTIALGVFVMLMVFSNYLVGEDRLNLKYYSRLMEEVRKDNVKSLSYYEGSDGKPAKFKGEFVNPVTDTDGFKQTRQYRLFEVNWPNISDKDFAEIEKKVPNIAVREQDTSLINYLMSLLPWIILFAIFILFTRRMQSGIGTGKSGGGGIFSIGKIKTQMLTKDEVKTTFEDVAGADEAKVELEEVIDFLKNPLKYQKLGGKIPKGVLLTGPPGTGKTLLARAVAGEAGVPFFSISGSDFVEMFVGVGASRVRDLFEQARKNSPCIVFVDEIDAVGRQRGVGLGGGNDEREQTLNALLVEMDGFDDATGVIIMAATNRPDVLDHALLRPGRFDRRIVVERPDLRGRRGILEVHTRNVPLAEDVDIDRLAMGTPGFSGADLANLVNEAALLAARYDKDAVEMEDFENSKDKVMLGLERKTLIMKEEEKLATAYHESGHTILGKMLKDQDPVYKVTIIPRGFALGVTWSMPKDDVVTQSREYLQGKITMLLGGRVAEKIIFDHLSSGARNDIERATQLARSMVCELGMSDEIGPLHFRDSGQESFTKAFSEKTAEAIDAEVKRIVVDAETEATRILTENKDILERMAKELFERETLTSDEIDKIINDEELPPFVKSSKRTDRDRLKQIEEAKKNASEGKTDQDEDHGLEGNEVPAV